MRPQQFRDAAHLAAVARARTSAELRGRLLGAVHDHARADSESSAETYRLRALALCRELLRAERARYSHTHTLTAKKEAGPA